MVESIKLFHLRMYLKENEEMTWDEMKKFKPTQYLSLHSLMYKKVY